jgi:hypothetical protein
MKKLLFLILLLLPLSCEKDRSIECWTCRWEMKVIEFNAYYSTCRDTCMTERDKISYETKGTYENAMKKEQVTCWKQGDPPIWEPGF